MSNNTIEFYNSTTTSIINSIPIDKNKSIDLANYLIINPKSTVHAKVHDNSYSVYGIYPEDLLIIDCSMTLTDTHICIIKIQNEVTIKRIKVHENKFYMVSETSYIKPIEIIPELQIKIIGVITFIIHQPDYKS